MSFAGTVVRKITEQVMTNAEVKVLGIIYLNPSKICWNQKDKHRIQSAVAAERIRAPSADSQLKMTDSIQAKLSASFSSKESATMGTIANLSIQRERKK